MSAGAGARALGDPAKRAGAAASRRKLGISVITLVLAVAIPELALRVSGWKREPGIQFGYPRPAGFAAFERDPELFWKLAPRSRASGHQAPGNSLGFPGPEIELPKPEGVYRMLFLGDSCTYLGFPARVKTVLDERSPELGAEPVVLAIPGYSSHQGRVVAEKYARDLEGDLAVVFYGWNDHWLAYGSIDSQKAARTSGAGALRRSIGSLRLVQAASAVLGGSAGRLEAPRVLPGEYRENLRAIVRVLREGRAAVVMITAPTSFYREGVPQPLIELGFAADGSAIVDAHRAYNAIVREVTRETEAVLLDLEAEAEAMADVGKLFGSDGIHFSERGELWVADRLAEIVSSLNAR